MTIEQLLERYLRLPRAPEQKEGHRVTRPVTEPGELERSIAAAQMADEQTDDTLPGIQFI